MILLEVDMRVYISGGITGVSDYKEHFEYAEKKLKEQGYEVVNPAKINALLPTSCTHEEYMKVSIAELSVCDAIYLLMGYENSKGAAEELFYAIHNKYKIMKE